MRTELPTQEQIIEELADRVAAQIDQRRPVAFDNALEELIRYHRFVLGLGASTTTDGAPFNYAEVAGSEWRAPHRSWLMQYRRLFELAADRVPDNDHFLGTLAYSISRLLRLPEGLVATRAIAESVLDLFPSLMHAVEAWVTRRAVLSIDDHAADRGGIHALAGSDAKAHAAMLRRVVGAWESLLTHAPMMGEAAKVEGKDELAQWSSLGHAWPVAWTHLLNTAYCLALCVWNNDSEGALLFREALVRWPENYRFTLPDAEHLRRADLLFPDLLEQDWPAARDRFAALAFGHRAQVAPGGLLATALDGAHDDVVQVVAGLLTLWAIQDKPAAPLAARTANELLAQEGLERHGAPPIPPSFGDLLFRSLRLQMAGGRHRDGSYGARLDALVQMLDRLSERDVVAGRSYTPTTLFDRDQLLLADVALVARFVDHADKAAVLAQARTLAENDDILPRGDRSLRDVLHELGRYHRVAADRQPAAIAGIERLGGEAPEHQLVLFGQLIAEVEQVIVEVRKERLRSSSVDPARLATWQAAVEKALLDPANHEFFASAALEKSEQLEIGELCSYRFPDYARALLTDPQMDDPSLGEIEAFSEAVADWADGRTFGVLNDSTMTPVSIDANPLDPAFWTALSPLVAKVGPAPRLMLPTHFHSAMIDAILSPETSSLAGLRLVNAKMRGRGHIAEIDGVDVYLEPLEPHRAILFSGERLQRVRYGLLENGAYVRATYRPNDQDGNDGVHGSLEFQFRQELTWNDTPVFEITLAGAPKADAMPD